MRFEAKINRRLTAVLLAGFWVLSLFIPSLGWGLEEPVPGYGILATGWLGIFSLQFGWFANLIFLGSIGLGLATAKPEIRISGVLSFLLVVLTINALFWSKARTPDGDYPVVYGPGYYVWISVMLITAVWILAISVFSDS